MSAPETGMHAHVKFLPPYRGNPPANYPVSEIVASVGPLSHVGPRQEVPFSPKTINDYEKNHVYLLKTKHLSADGNFHQYYCVIGRIRGSLAELEASFNSRARVSWPTLPETFVEPVSSGEEQASQATSVGQLEDMRSQTKSVSVLKNKVQTKALNDYIANNTFDFTLPTTTLESALTHELKNKLRFNELTSANNWLNKILAEKDEKLAELKQTEHQNHAETTELLDLDEVRSEIQQQNKILAAALENFSSMDKQLSEMRKIIHEEGSRIVNEVTEALRNEKSLRKFIIPRYKEVQAWVDSIPDVM